MRFTDETEQTGAGSYLMDGHLLVVSDVTQEYSQLWIDSEMRQERQTMIARHEMAAPTHTTLSGMVVRKDGRTWH